MRYTFVMDIHRLVHDFPIISDQIASDELTVILRKLQKVLERSIPGAVTEFGCYSGTTSLFIRRVLDTAPRSDAREFHVYDSFAGLPDKVSADVSPSGEQFKAGELNVSKKQFIMNFKRAGLALPVIHKGWFSELSPDDVPDAIAFAFLDGDFYDSILDSLRLVWPRLAPGGIVTIDDYAREALPGVERAVADFFHGTPENLRHEASIAIIQKQ